MAKRTNHTVEPLFVQQIVDMYSSGKNQKEITETTGQSYFVVRYWLKKKGLFDPSRRRGNTKPSMQEAQKNNERIKQAWDNVQVAHRGCNSRKGTKLEEKAKAV